MRSLRLACSCALLVGLVAAQQTNGFFANMKFDTTDGPPWPIPVNVRSSTTSTVVLGGIGNQPLAIFKSGNGNVSPGAAVYGGQSRDLPLTPAPVVCVDGFVNPNFRLDFNGQLSFTVQVPAVGSPPNGVPLNFHDAFQAIIANPTTPFGYNFSAATRVTVTQGPTVATYQLGDDGVQAVSLAPLGAPLPFYGVNYTQFHLCSNGFITFNTPDSDFTPTSGEMVSGPPRLSAYWADLEQNVGTIRSTIDNNPPGQVPFVKVQWINVSDFGLIYVHTFDFVVDTTGMIVITYPPNNQQSAFDIVCGISPGGNLGPQGMKDLSALTTAGATSGAVNENFHEWFGLSTMPNYTPSPLVDRPYDLYSRTLTFLPIGSGTLPLATNRYVMY